MACQRDRPSTFQTDVVELETAVLLIGAKAREAAIKATKIIRAKSMCELSGDMD
jgi:hypothetical protein